MSFRNPLVSQLDKCILQSGFLLFEIDKFDFFFEKKSKIMARSFIFFNVFANECGQAPNPELQGLSFPHHSHFFKRDLSASHISTTTSKLAFLCHIFESNWSVYRDELSLVQYGYSITYFGFLFDIMIV